ncbi:MAG: hypothetical protein R3E82_15790 [Pseudomonadales bacterium]
MMWRSSLIIAVLAFSQVAFAASWQTTRFSVSPGPPLVNPELLGPSVDIFAEEANNRDDSIPQHTLDEIAAALSDAAQWYESRNFPEPVLFPVVDTPEGPAFQVYACSERWVAQGLLQGLLGAVFGENAAVASSPYSFCDKSGAYTSICGNYNRNQFFYLNLDRTTDANGRLNANGYQTIAHEMMHAISERTALGGPSSCQRGKWLGEGLADAISFDIMEEIWSGRFIFASDDNAVSKRYGTRPYSIPLTRSEEVPVPNTQNATVLAGYQTSSFWRYIADASGVGWRILTNSSDGRDTGILHTSMPNQVSPGNEVDWLDRGLRNRLTYRLRDLFGLFANQFAHQVPPLSRFQGEPAEDNVDEWVQMAFDDCREVTLSNDRPSDLVSLEIEPLAGRCVWVNPTNWPGLVQISFQAISTDRQLLEDISIGRAGTALLSRAVPIGQLGGPGSAYVSSWRDYPQDGSERTLYVVTNFATTPSSSRARQFDLSVSLPMNTVSTRNDATLPVAPVAPAPKPPTYDKRNKSVRQQRADTAKMVAEQMDADKRSLNAHTHGSTSVSRKTQIPPCTEPFRYQACGPRLEILLSVVPGTYAAPGQTTAAGGIAAQVFGGLQAMSATSLWDSQPVMQELVAQLDQIDGSNVSIAIPLIDYGFSGSFDNASIHVDMSGDRTFRAIGPPDASGWPPLTGQVTILEYTPFNLRGSFTAPLAEFVPSGSDAPAIYVRRDTVHGTFNSVAPWQVDERVQTYIPDTQEEMAEDIANTLGVRRRPTPGTGSSSSGDGSAGSSGSGQVIHDCTCECEMQPFADELCSLLCEEEFALCE